MQIEWLRAFVLLKEKMNFSEAAAEMFVSQSSFSKYIKALETTMGTTLIDRSRHKIRFTESGEAVYGYAKGILSDYDGMLEYINTLNEKENQNFRVSVVSSTNASFYLRSILTFFDERPDIRLMLYEYDMKTALRLLEEGELDLLMGYTNLVGSESKLDELVLRKEELYFVGSRTEMKADAASVTLAEVTADRLILHQNNYDEVTSLLKFSGIQTDAMRPIVTTTSMDVLKAYLTGGIARSVLTIPIIQTLNAGDKLLALPIREKPSLKFGLLYKKKKLSYTGKELIRYLSARDGSS